MNYSRFIPNPILQPIVDCYWVVEGFDQGIQKIIPDGYSELIFHFGDAYEISHERGISFIQPHSIAAGQLSKPVFLKPTGKSGVFGIKFKPAGLWNFLGCDMHLLTNTTYSLDDIVKPGSQHLVERLQSCSTNDQRIEIIETYLLNHWNPRAAEAIDLVISDIRMNRGQLAIETISRNRKLSVRKMERLFHQRVGISAKLYSRLIRFTYVFNLLQQSSITKAEACYLSGYFDQAHFNKDFKSFTDENPEMYFENNHTFANFFMNA
jgi:AraC-like DNA-binding protein